MTTINLSTTDTVTMKPEDQYIVLWPVSIDPNSAMNMNIGDKLTTEFLLSKLSNEGIKTVLCFNIKNAVSTSSKVLVTIKEG